MAIKIGLVRSANNEPGLAIENSTLKKLQHKVHFPFFVDSGKFGQLTFMVMELVGRDLGDLHRSCKDGRFMLSTAIRTSLERLEIIESVHASGFLHRDIKPTNFTIGATSAGKRTIYLLDFGLVGEFLNGELPWRQGSDREKVAEMKGKSNSIIFNSQLSEIRKVYERISKLTYSNEPQYHSYKKLFNDVMQKNALQATNGTIGKLLLMTIFIEVHQ